MLAVTGRESLSFCSTSRNVASISDILSGVATEGALSVEQVWVHACENGLTSIVRLMLADELIDAVKGNHVDVIRLLEMGSRFESRATSATYP